MIRVGLLLLVAGLVSPGARACSCFGLGLPGILLNADGTSPAPTEDEIRAREQRAAVGAASERIDVATSVDNDELGLALEFRASFHNPTQERLEVWDPLNPANRFIYVDTDKWSCFCPGMPPESTRWIEPGETLHLAIRLEQPRSAPGELPTLVPWMTAGLPGEHTLYWFWAGTRSGKIPFRVLPPQQAAPM